jgi:hypothetical protein
MTTATTTASNGSTETTTTDTGRPEKPFGMAVVREAETYHDASVLHDAVFEANQLCTTIQHAISDAYFRDVRKTKTKDTGLTATQTAESPPMQAKTQELLNCLQAAQTYVQRLLVSTYDSPF